MRRILLGGLLLLALGAGAARAADEDEQKKQEREWKKLEEKQKGGEKKHDADPKGAPLGGELDPAERLKKILDLMMEVESRLAETDPGEYTQEDQRKIVEAMKFEDKTKQALDDLIEKLEHDTGS